MDNDTFINCDLCQIPFTGIEPYQQHLLGKKHLKRLKEKSRSDAEKGPFTPEMVSEDGQCHCNFCGITLDGMAAYNEHLLTDEHLRQIREHEEEKCKETEKNAPAFHCPVCKTVFSGIVPMEQHMRSGPHEKALRKAKLAESLASGNSDMTPYNEEISSDDIMKFIRPEEYSSCNICSKNFNGPESYADHMNSNVHKKKVLQQKIALDWKGKLSSDFDGHCVVIRDESQVPAGENETAGEIRCVDCDKKFSSSVPFAQHMYSNAHKKKVRQNEAYKQVLDLESQERKAMQDLAEGGGIPDADDPPCNPVLTCDACNLSFSGPESAKDHFAGKKHAKSVKWAHLLATHRKVSKDKAGAEESSLNHDDVTEPANIPSSSLEDDSELVDPEVTNGYPPNSESTIHPPAPKTYGLDDSKPSNLDIHLYGPKVKNSDPNSDDGFSSADKKVHIDTINFPVNPSAVGADIAVKPSAPILDEDEEGVKGNNEAPHGDPSTAGGGVLYPQLDDLLQDIDEKPNAGPDVEAKKYDENEERRGSPNSSNVSDDDESGPGTSGDKQKKKTKTGCKGFKVKKFVASVANMLD